MAAVEKPSESKTNRTTEPETALTDTLKFLKSLFKYWLTFRCAEKPIGNFVSVVIMIMWAFSCGGALALSILADVFQRQTPAFPLVPTIVTSIGLNAFCAFTSALLGWVTLRGFYLYQPFSGGQSFIVLQGFGYGTLVISGIMMFVYVEYIAEFAAGFYYGALTVLGCFNALAHIFLMTSLLFFVPKLKRRRVGKTKHNSIGSSAATWWRDLSTSPNAEIAIVVLICVAIFVCFSISEYWCAVRRVVSIVGAVLFIVGLAFIHVSIGYWHTPGYSFFSLNTGTCKIALMKVIGWFFVVATLHMDMILYEAGQKAPSSLHILCGLTSVIGLSVLLLFLRINCLSRDTQNTTSLPGKNAPLVLTVLGIIHAAMVWGIVLVLSFENYIIEPQLRQGLVMCQTLCSILSYFLPPCTHLIGRIAFGREYEVWMPFKGPLPFVVLQSLGWTCFGVAIFFSTLQISKNMNFIFIIIGVSLTTLSQLFIHASLYLFDERHTAQSLKGRTETVALSLGDSGTFSVAGIDGNERKNRKKDRKENQRKGGVAVVQHDGVEDKEAEEEEEGEEEASLQEFGRSIVKTVLNGELFTAILLSLVGIFLRVIADLTALRGNTLDEVFGVQEKSFLETSIFIMCLAVPLAHISMRARISIWRPFIGSGAYVAMQSIGWSLYVVIFLNAVAHKLFDKRQNMLVSTNNGHYIPFEYTMEGLFCAIPLICIIMSAFFEAQAQNKKKEMDEKNQRKVLELSCVLNSTILDEEKLHLAHTLLNAIARPQWQKKEAKTDRVQIEGEEKDKAMHVRHEAATQIASILSVASTVAFISAAFLANIQPVFTLVFGVAGVTVTTISCFSLHFVYGTLMHRESGRFSFFMPFSGGSAFVVFQILGWSFYTASSLLILLSCAARRGFALVFVAAGVFSVAGQMCILSSIPRFDPTPRPMSFLERNAEGIIAVLALVSSFALALVSDTFLNDSDSGMTFSLLPITLLVVSTCFAIPLGFLSLRRNATSFDISSRLIFDNSVYFRCSDDDDSDVESFLPESVLSFLEDSRCSTDSLLHTMSTTDGLHTLCDTSVESDIYLSRLDNQILSGAKMSHGLLQRYRTGFHNSIYLTCFIIASAVAVLLSLLTPFAFFYLAYFCVYRSVVARYVGFTSLVCVLGGFGISVLVALFASTGIPGKPGEKTLRRSFTAAVCCYALYSIPTFIVVGACGLPFIVKTAGAWVFAGSMVVMSCISTIPYVHFITLLCNVCILSYFFRYHFYISLFQKKEPFELWKCVADTFLTAFWILYFRSYAHKPHINGRLFGSKTRNFCQCWFFNAVADYFDLRVIVDGKEEEQTTSGNANSTRNNERVDLTIPGNKYLFSFHPHGIFPGSALWVPNTEQWEAAVGSSEQNGVSVHCADVVFSVPLLRDIVLSLGGLSVSRKALDSSLLLGNSVIIVTGGQSEMLLSKCSDTEMHLVTHHSGFVCMALAHKVPIVPLICFAEHNVLANINLPTLQRYSVKKLGFPFPTIPFGRWYLPLPNARPLTVVVGRPVFPEAGMCSPEVPEHVGRYKQRYFEAVVALFFRYRVAAGYPEMRLVLHNHDEVRVLADGCGAGGGE